MARYADINQIATNETVNELLQPGSSIGKFGDYPVGEILDKAIKRDNIRSGKNFNPKMDYSAEK